MMEQNPAALFSMLKMRFPHLQVESVNPEASFSENLQAIVSQIMMPQQFQLSREIVQMKQVVDHQELKIQKNLINGEDGYSGEIYYYNTSNNPRLSKNTTDYSYMEQNHSISGQMMGDMMSDIWQLQSNNKNQDWFNH